VAAGRLPALLALAAGTTAPAPIVSSAAPATAARVLFRLADPRISEASGIAPGIASPGVFYVQNDSGDTHRFFALDRRSGATEAIVTVAGAHNVDWEDIAVARDAAGTPSVWLADIGDNDAARAEIRVYRVPEPRIDPADRVRTIRRHAGAVWRLRYPGAPIDAESLAVAPGGVAYVLTKSAGLAVVYRLPSRPAAGRVQVLHRVASVPLAPTGTPNPFGVPGQVVATSAAFSADGSLFALRTYSDAYIWRVGPSGLRAALRSAPTRVALPRQRQGEGIAVTGRGLVVDSEGRGSAVYAVPLPSALAAPGPSSPAPTAAGSAAPAAGSDRGALRIGVLLGVFGVALLAVVVVAVGHARRRAELE
jgi:hypothetical protein